MRQSTAILLSVVMVMSMVAPATAQTATQTDTGPITYEFDGTPDTLVIDTSAMTGGTEFEVEYTTQGGPSTGTTVLARQTFNTGALDQDELLFYNAGAYESVNVTVSGYEGGEPTFTTRSGLGSVNLQRTVVGSTGGDTDLNCETGEKLAQMTKPFPQLDCTTQPGTTGVNTTGTDAEQVKTDIYQSAQNQKASSEIYQTTLDNYLEDTKTQARIIGKNAYIRALNNGSSEAAAKTAAKDAVADYYATKQANLLKQWAASRANYEYLVGVAENESGITQTGIDNYQPNDYLHINRDYSDADPNYVVFNEHTGYETATVTLSNGTSKEVTRFSVKGILWSLDNNNIDTNSMNPSAVGPTTGTHNITKEADRFGYSVVRSFEVRPPDGTGDHSPVEIINLTEYHTAWTEIESQNDAVQADMDTLATNTYDAYQSGEINNSDLVDPYVFAQEFSPGDEYQGWAATHLTMLGTSSPKAMDSVGEFNISSQNGDFSGILMSQTNPASGQFENGSTYDPANISGTQYVVTEDSVHELTTPFTIDSIETASGESRENVTIEKTVYETADVNVTELKEGYEELAYRRAQIEARESALAGGGGLFGGSEQSTIAIVAVAGAAILLLKN